MRISIHKNYLAYFGVELYLLLTLLVFFVGPIEYKIHNVMYFGLIMFLCHGFFTLGYAGGVVTFRVKHHSVNEFSKKIFYLYLFFAVLGVLKAYQNATLGSSLIPYNIFDEVSRGFINPGLVYSEQKSIGDVASEGGSRLFNIISILFAFFKLLFIFYFVYYWNNLSIFQKFLSVAYSALFVSPGLASGTNSQIFIFFIFFCFSFFVKIYMRNSSELKRILFFLIILMLIPIYSFGSIMAERGGGFEYFAGTSPLGDISISIRPVAPEDAGILDFFLYSFVWLSYYVVQGYYGFSLILNLDHDWTFGFGSSAFLQRQFEQLTGVNLSSMTFQNKIDMYWDSTAQWHSFYGQLANDFSVPGLILPLFIIGFIFARIWMSAIIGRSFFAASLLPIFILMFIFFPANNQVFGFIDTFSYVIFVTLLWILDGRKLQL